MSERATITFVPTSKNKISDDISFLKACVNMFKEEGYENLSPEARKLAEKPKAKEIAWKGENTKLMTLPKR